jgi:hypothetical protein
MHELIRERDQREEGAMLHLRHWKMESHPCAKERELEKRCHKAVKPKAAPPHVYSASNEDQCLTGELYLYQDFLHDEFPDNWKASPSDTKVA